tara:strand:+ start:12147 stop:12335 length:189 start_codon:yes stop_codon:yes gene_type:complete
MKVTSVQLRVLVAMDPTNKKYDPSHRPRNSLERLAKKGLVFGNKKTGWSLTDKGKMYLLRIE